LSVFPIGILPTHRQKEAPQQYPGWRLAYGVIAVFPVYFNGLPRQHPPHIAVINSTPEVSFFPLSPERRWLDGFPVRIDLARKCRL